MAAELDADRLVVLVQARSSIYNLTLKDYHNKDLTEKLWDEIAQEMNATAADCKLKWNNLRSSYSRYLRTMKNTPSGSGASKKKKWYLSEAMGFLKDYVCQHKKMSSNVVRTEESDDEEQVAETEVFNEDNNSATSETYSNKEVPERLNTYQRKRTTPTSAAEILAGPMAAFLKSRTENPSEVDKRETSPMLNFFKGMLPDKEQLTPQRKRKFKEEIVKLVNNMMDEQEHELSQLHSRSSSRPTSVTPSVNQTADSPMPQYETLSEPSRSCTLNPNTGSQFLNTQPGNSLPYFQDTHYMSY